MQNDREAEIQRLCIAILDIGLEYDYNPNGPDSFRCPLCHAETGVNYKHHTPMSPVVHDVHCPQLIAKDLMTGIDSKSSE